MLKQWDALQKPDRKGDGKFLDFFNKIHKYSPWRLKWIAVDSENETNL